MQTGLMVLLGLGIFLIVRDTAKLVVPVSITRKWSAKQQRALEIDSPEATLPRGTLYAELRRRCNC